MSGWTNDPTAEVYHDCKIKSETYCGGAFPCDYCKRWVGYCFGGEGDGLCSECCALWEELNELARNRIAND